MDGQALRFPDKRIRQILYLVLSVVFLGLMVRGPLEQRDAAVSTEEYRSSVSSAFEKLMNFVMEKQDAEEDPEKYGDMALEGKGPGAVRQVDDDQHWVNGNSYGEADAVYMVDGVGNLVYFSYHDGVRATTWSGPSIDKDFLASHGGWNGGNGSGWTGFKVN